MIPGLLAHYAALTLPEERFEDDRKTITVRRVPLGKLNGRFELFKKPDCLIRSCGCHLPLEL